MERIREIAGWLIRHASGIVYLAGLLVSAGVFPALLALSREASPLEYGIAAAAGLMAFVFARAAWMRARLWRSEARIRERLTSDSSPFDPMARVFQDKRLFLRDLAPAGRRQVKGKKFINCEIIGPGSIVVALRSHEGMPFPEFKGNIFHDVDLIEVNQSILSNNAVYFSDCDFDGCNFYTLNLLMFYRIKNDWHWITPDFDQPKLIEDQTGAQ